jgi:SNF2 family DNA or RNA helicase
MIDIKVAKSNKCNGDYSIFLSFPYDNALVELIRGQSERYWDKDNKTWEVPAKRLRELLPYFTKHEVNITGDFSAFEEVKKVANVPAEFQFKTKPYDHQIDGLNFGLTHDKWLLGDEQGLGKTKQVIDIAVAKKLTGANRCLIICGVNGLKWNWQNEIKTHSNESGWILGQRKRKSGKIYIGSTKDKLEDLKNINDIQDYFLITNVESLRDADIAATISEYCKKGIISMVAIDEIHKCKNPSSQQGKGILKIKADVHIAMSGTPLMNTPLDLFIILRWLGYEKHAFYQFKNHYCIMGGYGGYDVVGYKNMPELQERVDSIMLRRLKDEVLDLPEKVYIDEYVEMTAKQEQVYKEISADIKANIDKIKMANNPLAELIRMRQATGYTGILSSTILESAKIDRLEEIVEESVANNRKVVIFSNWTQMTSPIYSKLCKNYKGVIITGETDDVERQVNVNHFQNNPDCKFIIGTIGAMGTGLTLTAGTVVVFMDEPWTMANKQQAIDRCHRIGTKSNITIYTIMCKNTIDERIHEIVEKKGMIADAIIDGKVVGNKTELLDFLLS